jgi:uncharacterized protein YjgD (DUF1641 family)
MAQPITLELPHSDHHAQLQARLQQASTEHAEALLEAFEVLQALHDSGTLDLLRGLLVSKNKVLDVAVSAADSEGPVRALRNGFLIFNMLSAIDPNVLRYFTEPTAQAMRQMLCEPEAPGLWRLIKDFLHNRDFRHGLSAINTMLEEFGRTWSDAKCRETFKTTLR